MLGSWDVAVRLQLLATLKPWYPPQTLKPYFIAACAAARRAMGTRKGEQET